MFESEDHEIKLGVWLRKSGQSSQAFKIFLDVLKRDRSNSSAKKELFKLSLAHNISVHKKDNKKIEEKTIINWIISLCL